MSTSPLIRQGISSLLHGAIIDILAEVPGAHKAVDLLKQKFTLTAAEIAEHFQSSYGYALAAISVGLVAPENQRDFLPQAEMKSEFAQLAIDYLLPFAQQQSFSEENLIDFRKTAITQCQEIAKLTLFQAENVPFSEAELAQFIAVDEVASMTQLLLTQIQLQYQLAPSLITFFRYRELLGNALLLFLHERLRREPRFKNTLVALQREGLLIEVGQIKQIMQATKAKLKQAYVAKQFDEVAQSSQHLEHLQQIEFVTQTNYAQFIEFEQNFSQWTQFFQEPFEDIFQQIAALKARISSIESDTQRILEILQKIRAPVSLSAQIKPRDELTQYSSDNLNKIKQAQQLLKCISPSDLQDEQLAIFELLHDYVEEVPEKSVELVDFIKQLPGWLSPISYSPKPKSIELSLGKIEIQEQMIQEIEKIPAEQKIVQPQKAVKKPSQPEQSLIVQIDKRQWWNQLDDDWKTIFKEAINIKDEPNDNELDKIINLPALNFRGGWDRKITSLEPLCALTNLQELNCGFNKISDLQPLRALTNLRKLHCWENRINDLQPLCALTNLQELVCDNNQISDLQPLHALTNLQELACDNNQISDLQPLRALTNLQILECGGNQISDLQPLRALTNLQVLECGGNQISDLQPLGALTNLQMLDCWGNQISRAEIEQFKKAMPDCEVE